MRRATSVVAGAFALALAGCAGGGPVASSPESTPSVSVSETTNVGPFFLGDGGQSGAAYREAVARGDAEDADLLARIALTPQAEWYGAWTPSGVVGGLVDGLLDAADEQGTIAVFAVYAIPNLDCSTFAPGGLTADTYLPWVEVVAGAIDGRHPWVILEPDALSQWGSCEGQGDRIGLLSAAAEALDDAGARVYLDAGNARWLPVEEEARRIELVGTEHLTGFSLNVANTIDTEETRAYGDRLAELTGLHYVIDTGRNGNGSNGEWCNARGRALGETPRLVGGESLDAYLWVKRPGESDGTCANGPAGGYWWQEVALELAANAAASDET